MSLFLSWSTLIPQVSDDKNECQHIKWQRPEWAQRGPQSGNASMQEPIEWLTRLLHDLFLFNFITFAGTAENSRQRSNNYKIGCKPRGQSLEQPLRWGRNIFAEFIGSSGRTTPTCSGRKILPIYCHGLILLALWLVPEVSFSLGTVCHFEQWLRPGMPSPRDNKTPHYHSRRKNYEVDSKYPFFTFPLLSPSMFSPVCWHCQLDSSSVYFGYFRSCVFFFFNNLSFPGLTFKNIWATQLPVRSQGFHVYSNTISIKLLPNATELPKAPAWHFSM